MALTDNGNGLSAADVAAVVGNNGAFGNGFWGPNHDRYYDIHAYGDGGSTGRYSRADAKERMINGLYSMKNDAANEADRGAIQECINRLRA